MSGTSPFNSARDRVYFPNLDGLRFLAFLLVYMQHGFGIGGNLGGIGVAFFFVLSGFLITFLILTEADRTGSVDVAWFYVRRCLRIWPLYYAVLLFCFVVYPGVKVLAGLPPTLEVGSGVLYFLFLSNFDVLELGGDRGAGSTNVTWSVAIEEQFYLLWPILLRTEVLRRRAVVFLLVIIGSFWFRLRHASEHVVLYFHTFSVISDMAVGGLLAHLCLRSPRFVAAVRQLSTGSLMLGYSIGLASLAMDGFWGRSPFLTASKRLAHASFFGFVVLEQNYSSSSLVKLSRWPLLTRLGRYTYGLYLLHMIVLTLLERWMYLFDVQISSLGWPSRLAYGAVGLLLVVALSALSYHLFESRFLSLKRKFSHVASGST